MPNTIMKNNKEHTGDLTWHNENCVVATSLQYVPYYEKPGIYSRVLKISIGIRFRKSRATFDTTETRREFGPIIVDYAKVQSKVSLKYDSWHKDVLQKFGTYLGQEMTDFHGTVSKASEVQKCLMLF